MTRHLDKIFDRSQLSFHEWCESVYCDLTDIEMWARHSCVIGLNIMHECASPNDLIGYASRFCDDVDESTELSKRQNLGINLMRILGDPNDVGFLVFSSEVFIDLSERLKFIHSLGECYKRVVASYTFEGESASYLFVVWDLLASNLWIEIETRHSLEGHQSNINARIRKGLYPSKMTKDEIVLYDGMGEELCKLLDTDDQFCETCALHGLGHLDHPKTKSRMLKYIKRRKSEWSEDELRWAQSCVDGTVE